MNLLDSSTDSGFLDQVSMFLVGKGFLDVLLEGSNDLLGIHQFRKLTVTFLDTQNLFFISEHLWSFLLKPLQILLLTYNMIASHKE